MASGLSLRELGERTHYSKGHLSKIENGIVGGHLDLARACDQVLAAEGQLTSAFLATFSGVRGRQAEPAPDTAFLATALLDTALPGAPELMRMASSGLIAALGGRSHDGTAAQLVSGYVQSAAAADQVISPGRHAPGPAVPALFASAADALAWCAELSDAVPLVCALALELGMNDECWQLAYAFRGYFFTTGAVRPWASSHAIALRAAERAGNPWAQAVTRNNLGMALLEQGRASAAEAEHGAALRICRAIADDYGVAATLGHQAWASHVAGQSAMAVDLASRAIEIHRGLASLRPVAIMNRTAALAHARLGQHAEALRCLAECKEILSCHDLPQDDAMLLNCLGEVHFGQGQFQAAARYHARAAERSAACGALAEQARAERLYRRAASMSSTVFASP